MIYLLDANTLGDLARKPGGRVAESMRMASAAKIVTSIIVCCEVEYGLAWKKSEKLRAQMEKILGGLEVLDFGAPAHQKYGELRALLRSMGKPIGPNDLFIAAHALALDAVLVTDNEKEFSRVPGLKIENWLR
jgi:tRNA(fMet)-specific endonuclease VapC